MSFPPLKDPLEDPSGKDSRNDRSDEAPASQPAPPQPAGPPAADHELDDDDLEELNEQVDLDHLDDLRDLGDLDHLDDLGRVTPAPPPYQPVPAGIKTEEARIAGDEPIPMLTEVVQVPRYDSEDLPQTLADVDWGDLSQRVRENVLERLLRRSDALLDAQLQNTLTPVLERAAETVAHELHDALNRMIRDIVARAVTEELTRLHAEIARRNRSSRPS